MTLCTRLFSIALLISKHCCPSKCPSTGNRFIYGSAVQWNIKQPREKKDKEVLYVLT